MSSASTTPDETSEPLLTKLRLALAGIAITFIGTMVSTWFSDRSSTWQAYVAKIDKDTTAILGACGDAADLINERWYALNRMADAIQNSVDGDEWEAARKEYSEVDRKWALKFTTVESDIRFNVDETFPAGVDAAREDKDLDLISLMPCTRIASSDKWRAVHETKSARVIMAAVNHCLGDAKSELDEAISAKLGSAAKLDSARLASLVKQPRDALGVAYWTHSTLRCVVLERELALRPIAVTQSYWSKFFGALPAKYDLPPDSKNCRAIWVAHAEKPNAEVSSANLVN
jgi:hypothetical protein